MALKRILITGASGAIGKEVVRILSERLDRYEVKCLVHNPRTTKRIGQYAQKVQLVQGDITNINQLLDICKGIDVVIHLAAIIPPLADKKPELARKVNVNGSKNLIHALEQVAPNAFLIYASSISVYGDRLNSPDIRVGDPLKESLGDNYAITKIETEALIQNSSLKWTIFRLTGILDPELNKPDPLMFHMPLNTSFEICTTRDCGLAFANALDHLDELNNRVFNLAGGPSCRATFGSFLEEAFKRSGLGKLNFPTGAFAEANFHCGYYQDGDDLEDILHFQNDSKEDYFDLMEAAIPKWQKFSASLFAPIIKWFMLQSSDPWKAKKSNDPEGLKRYFGIS